MARAKRAVFLKQSGELLEQPGGSGHWLAAAKVAAKIANSYKQLDDLGISGLSIVTGGGNLARGDELKNHGMGALYADTLGRWATLGNSMALASALAALGVPVELMISDKMRYQDKNINFLPYAPQLVKQAHAKSKIVVLAGGIGQDNMTTDSAVAFYALDYRRAFGGEVVVLKSTKYDGVYEGDPKAGPRDLARYKKISAHTMREHFDRYGVVDKTSLDQIIEGDLTMIIYKEQAHALKDVLAHRPNRQTGSDIGTLVVPEACASIKY